MTSEIPRAFILLNGLMIENAEVRMEIMNIRTTCNTGNCQLEIRKEVRFFCNRTPMAHPKTHPLAV